MEAHLTPDGCATVMLMFHKETSFTRPNRPNLIPHGALVGGYPADELSLGLRDLRQLFGADAARPLVAAPLHLRCQAGLGHGEEGGEADDGDGE